MNKQTKTEVTKCQRRYASGILMYRERKSRFAIPAGTTVKVLKHGPKQTLVGLPKQFNGWMTMIPNEALPAFRNGAKPARTKRLPVVAGEPAGAALAVRDQAI